MYKSELNFVVVMKILNTKPRFRINCFSYKLKTVFSVWFSHVEVINLPSGTEGSLKYGVQYKHGSL